MRESVRSEQSAQLDKAKKRSKQIKHLFADMDRLAEEIEKYWHKGVSAIDAVRDVRRDL